MDLERLWQREAGLGGWEEEGQLPPAGGARKVDMAALLVGWAKAGMGEPRAEVERLERGVWAGLGAR